MPASIGEDAFNYCEQLKDVYYSGSKSDFEAISISSGNARLLSANIHYNAAYSGDTSGLSSEDDSGIKSSEKCGYNAKWSFENGTLTVSGTGRMFDYSHDVPWYDFCEDIKCVIIENGITSIGDYAFFDLKNITSVTIPDSVASIGRYAFYYCENLTNITIPDSVTSIGWYAFSGCGLTSVTVPDSVTSIEACVFYGCKGLKSITIPESVTSIEVTLSGIVTLVRLLQSLKVLLSI